MKIPRLAAPLCFAFTLHLAHAEDLDVTKRSVTDPLLKLSSSSALLPEKDDKWLGAVRDEKHIPPVYRRLWSQQDVIMLEAFSRQKPASIDVSEITRNHKGLLRISARNHPSGDFAIEILKAGQPVESETVGSSKWEHSRWKMPVMCSPEELLQSHEDDD